MMTIVQMASSTSSSAEGDIIEAHLSSLVAVVDVFLEDEAHDGPGKKAKRGGRREVSIPLKNIGVLKNRNATADGIPLKH